MGALQVYYTLTTHIYVRIASILYFNDTHLCAHCKYIIL